MKNDAIDDEWISKSQKKRECDALQKIGERLLKLKPEDLSLFDLPAELSEALEEARRIHSNSALKRQRQYLGKIMRSCDHERIEQQLLSVEHRNDTNTAQFKKIEKWRDRLIENDKEVLGEIIEEHPDIDRQHIHNLVRKASKEAATGKPPTASRKLFKYLRELAAASVE
jgi:ribosome-associated protein